MPLFITLAVEESDIIFAVDSIPAIFAITPDPFIVFTSNIFAMLGLRALYCAVSGFMQMFHALHYGFASIILILGIKMLLSNLVQVPIAVSLMLIVMILLICIIVSLPRLRRADRFISLADTLSPGRVIFNLQAASLTDAIRQIIARIPAAEWPVPPATIIQSALEREATMATYLGKGLAVPHARLNGIEKPVLAFARSEEGVALEGSNERAELFFLLLTPTGMARLQPLLLADIVGLFESEYVVERLRKADSPEEVIEAMRAGQ